MRRRSVLALSASAVLAGPFAYAQVPRSGLIGAQVFRWRYAHPEFGGVSALHLYPDGLRFVALTDRGWFFLGRLSRGDQGQIIAVEVDAAHALRRPDGTPLRKAEGDSEGLAMGADGTLFVAFEGRRLARVVAYAASDAPARALPHHPDFAAMPKNGSLEALAIDPAGTLFTLPETPVAGAHRVYALQAGAATWSVVGEVVSMGRFRPVAADVGPDGLFYLLERRFFGPLGFASRLRRFPPGVWGRGEVVFVSVHGAYDNLEGLSLTRDTTGGLRATLVSDDNFMPFQRTQLVEVALPEAAMGA